MFKSTGLHTRPTRNLIVLVILALLTSGTLAMGLLLPVQAAIPAQAQDATPTPGKMMGQGMSMAEMGAMMDQMMAHMNSMMGNAPMSGTVSMTNMEMMQMMGAMNFQMAHIQIMMGSMMSGETMDAGMMGIGAMDNTTDDTAAVPPNSDQQAMVHDMGGQVMPFDLSKSTHIFEMTESGGVQQVVAKDPQDTEQIALIQQHIQHEAMRFGAGDFSGPASLHGANMPGLKELASGSTQIQIEYMALPNGAQITFTTEDLHLITAIHRWFGAQLSDHGADAIYR